MLTPFFRCFQGLFLGSRGAAFNEKRLKYLKVTHILTVRNSDSTPYPNDFKYKTIKGQAFISLSAFCCSHVRSLVFFIGSYSWNIYVLLVLSLFLISLYSWNFYISLHVCLCNLVNDQPQENIRCHFYECFQFIDEARKGGGGILVHCRAGVSRRYFHCWLFLFYLCIYLFVITWEVTVNYPKSLAQGFPWVLHVYPAMGSSYRAPLEYAFSRAPTLDAPHPMRGQCQGSISCIVGEKWRP